jgi:hypothetical protein
VNGLRQFVHWQLAELFCFPVARSRTVGGGGRRRREEWRRRAGQRHSFRKPDSREESRLTFLRVADHSPEARTLL